MNKPLLIALSVLILLGIVYSVTFSPEVVPPPVTDGTVATTTPGHDTVVNDLVVLSKPVQGATVPSQFGVEGTARGAMFFEATFPIKLLDKNGDVLVQTHADAQGDWMTEGQVPFKAMITVPAQYAGDATLVFSKDNPSGLPENDASVSYSIRIVPQTSTSTTTQKACYVGGCSAQVCSDQPNAVSTCEYRAAYACYKTAKCERQATGQCGWTETPALAACLNTAQ